MHEEFGYEGGRFRGLKGFGGFSSSQGVLRKFGHKLFSAPYKLLGRQFAGFNKFYGYARSITARQGRRLDLDVLRQVITLSYLEDRVPHLLMKDNVALVIGDGFGSMTSLLLQTGMRVVLINLTRTLLVDLVSLRNGVPEMHFALVDDYKAFAQVLEDKSVRVIALRADDFALLSRAPISLAINIASMQEMNPEVTAGYFKAMRDCRSEVVFYCCNREEKVLPDGTLSKFYDYPWSCDDEFIDDGLCPWHQRYYQFKPPFYPKYDGPHWHRLVRLHH